MSISQKLHRSMLGLVLAALYMVPSALQAASPPVVLNGTLTLTTRSDAGPGNEAWSLTYTERGWATTVTGVIVKPIGTGPFPGVVTSHGKGGNAEGFGIEKGSQWFAPNGYITIAVNYTHAGDIFCRDEVSQCGGSAENVRRGDRAFQLLRSQNLIDLIGDVVNRDYIMLYGNSLGALTTIELAENLGSKIRAVALSAGGIYVEGVFAYMTPNGSAGVNDILAPMIHLHGRLDTVIYPRQQEDMSNALDLYDKVHQQVWFPDGGHNIARGSMTTNQVRDFILAWFSVYLNRTTPKIDSISVASGLVGDTVVIWGRKFSANVNGNSTVNIGGVAAEIVSWSDTNITATVPIGAVTGSLEVIVPVGPITDPVVEQPVNGGVRSNRMGFTVL